MRSVPVFAVDPSPWQQTLSAVVVLVAVVPVLAVVASILRRVVFTPRVDGRPWPEGSGFAGWARVPAEFLVDLTRSVPEESDHERLLADLASALRLGIALATFAVIPASAGLVATHLGVGLWVLPGAIGLATLLEGARLGWRVRTAAGGVAADAFAEILVGGTLLVGGAGVVALQWRSADLFDIAEAQAGGALFGIASVGAPTWLVHPVLAVVLCWAAHLVLVGCRGLVSSAGARSVIDTLASEIWLVAVAAWLAVVVFGGGSVPWEVTDDGVRHVVGASVLLVKVLTLSVVLVWSSVRWPRVGTDVLRRGLAVGCPVTIVSAVVTVVGHHLL